MNGQVRPTITANANGSGPERSSEGDDDGAVVVEGGELVAVEVAS
jgi:hypothetical protein